MPSGTYSLTVRGVGKAANGAHLGYSSYGCAGYYFIRGISGGAPPSPPIAMGQSLRTDEDTATAVTLSASDSEGGVLTYTVVTPPKFGVLTGTPPHLTYSPHADANGIDTFAFKAANGVGESAEAWVTVEVLPVNAPPVASAQSVRTDADMPISIRLTGSDPEAAELNYTIVRPPTRGELHGTAPDLTYTPHLNETGMDTFTFRVGDGVAESTEMEVTIEIGPMNDAPVAEGVVVTTEEDRPVGVRLSGRDVEGSPLTYGIVVAPTRGVLSGVPPELTYTPNLDATGTDSFTFKVNDGVADSPEATVTIEIAPVNDVPVARMTLTPQSGEAPLSVAFDGSGSSDVDGAIAGVAWDFGEGSSGIDVVARHTYTEPGTYGVTLTVTDTLGAVGIVRGVVEVAPNPSQLLGARAIDLSILPGARGNSVVATVRVTDRNGVVQPGVTVAGTFSGRIPRTIVARTDVDGVAVLTSIARRIPGAAVFRLEALSKKGFVHDPAFDAAVESSIEVPIWERGVELGTRE
ncbi:MAG: Ig-like domain-containing protein [Verrucomicrobiota bacterium]